MSHLVYILNLPNRKDRLASVLSEFSGKAEFNARVIQPEIDSNPRRSLWRTLSKIIANEKMNDQTPYIIICEDDHIFTENYKPDLLMQAINSARERGADILLGGVSWQEFPYQITDHLFYVRGFTGLQFTVVFRTFFKNILEANFSDHHAADKLISSLSDNKFIIYPTISSQKEFGYSDVTPKNNLKGRVDFLFRKTNNILNRYQQIQSHYAQVGAKFLFEDITKDNFVLPVYVLAYNNDLEKLKFTIGQFSEKDEFNISLVDSCIQSNQKVHEWQVVVNCVKKAIKENEDFFILCKDDHMFASHYNKDKFIEHIIGAYAQHADILLGGAESSGSHVPVASNRYWIENFSNSSYIVIYKCFYFKILACTRDELGCVDMILSKLSVNKMIIYPFISAKYNNDSSVPGKNNLITKQGRLKPKDDMFAIYCAIYDRFVSIA